MFPYNFLQLFALGVRSPSYRNLGSAMFTATFNLVRRVSQTSVIFGILKDGSLLIHT